jgi:hypothetical protein
MLSTLKTRVALVLAAMALMAVLASPASAQTIDLSPSVDVGDVVSGNGITAQCIGDPLLDIGAQLDLSEDQCADDGSTNTDGGLL